MQTKIALFLLALFLVTGCTPGSTDSSSNDNVSVQESSEGDNEGGSATTVSVSYHNQGRACLDCHGPGGEESFVSGATVYTALDATTANQYANGYKIRLVLENGQNVNYRSGRGTGNSYSEDSRLLSYAYTAQVVDSSGNVVNSSSAGSHDFTRVDCNRCHTSTGNSNAPGRIATVMTSATTATTTTTTTGTTTGSTTAGPFESDVFPILTATCSSTGCHGSSGTGGRFSVTTVAATYDNIASFSGIDTAAPTNSLLLIKASGSVSHGGGTVLLTTGTRYTTIRDWIAAGATLGTTTTTTAGTTGTTTGTTTAVSFANDVLPILTVSCKSCHGNNGRFSVTTAAATYSNIASFNGIDTANPTASTLLVKGSGGLSHGGGTALPTTSTGYTTIKNWITQGALNN